MHNPLRSEAEMFRVVVIVGVAAAPVIALGLIAGPEWGAIMLAVEAGVGIGLMWRALRGSDPHTAAVASSDDEVRRILVVANETVTGKALLSEIHGRCADRPSEVMVIVPALPGSRLEHLAHDVDAALAEARERLDASLRAMADAGIEARGEVGDHHDPNVAIEDALRAFAADEVIISTHPPERSKWLERGVVERARAEIPLPVSHVVVDLEAEAATPTGV
jgi:hypothetical protein